MRREERSRISNYFPMIKTSIPIVFDIFIGGEGFYGKWRKTLEWSGG